jgi:hypothetical protein
MSEECEKYTQHVRRTKNELYKSIKENLSRYCHAGDKGKRRNSSYSFLISALEGVSGQSHAPSAIYPRGKDRQYPLDRSLSGLQFRVLSDFYAA